MNSTQEAIYAPVAAQKALIAKLEAELDSLPDGEAFNAKYDELDAAQAALKHILDVALKMAREVA